MEIYLDKRAVRQIRLSAQDAIEEGDIETLREDILEAFTEEQVEEIERRLDSGDFFEFLTDLLDEWSGDDADELMELLDTQLGDVGIDLKFEKRGAAAQALRVVVSGGAVSPPLLETLSLLGREKTLSRIEQTLKMIENAFESKLRP